MYPYAYKFRPKKARHGCAAIMLCLQNSDSAWLLYGYKSMACTFINFGVPSGPIQRLASVCVTTESELMTYDRLAYLADDHMGSRIILCAAYSGRKHLTTHLLQDASLHECNTARLHGAQDCTIARLDGMQRCKTVRLQD